MNRCGRTDHVGAYVLHSLPITEAAAVKAHLRSCARCRQELETLQPSASLHMRLAQRIAQDTGKAPVLPIKRKPREPAWSNVAPGIWCQLLAADTERQLVSMLVRLEPCGEYPSHIHAGVEELHLLHGELWIDGRKLSPGDYSRAEPGSADRRVWSETGCICVLITSTQDILR